MNRVLTISFMCYVHVCMSAVIPEVFAAFYFNDRVLGRKKLFFPFFLKQPLLLHSVITCKQRD